MRIIVSLLVALMLGDTAARAADTLSMPLHDKPRALASVSFVDGGGIRHSLKDWRGKLVVLNIWATWCPPCRAEMPTLDRLKAKLGGAKFDVVALSIDRAGIPAVRKFFNKIEVEHLRIYVDDSQASARDLDALGLPVTILVAPDGTELGRLVGPAEWDSPDMITFFEEMIESQSTRYHADK